VSSSTICIDANLIVRRVLFPDDKAVQEAWETWTRENTPLIAPNLLFYEVTNALYRYQRQGLLRPETVNAALEAALALPVSLEGNAELHRQARRLAERWNLPAAYDAHYLALAERLGVDLFTCDQRLYNILLPFHLPWVRLVSG
jgi:predicted nucleic acid-binding protein